MPAINDFIASLRLRNLSENTIEAYGRDLGAIFGKSDPLKFKPAELKRRLAGLNISARSKARHLATLRSFYRWAVREGLITANPTELIDPIKIGKRMPTVLELDEVAAFMAAIKTSGSRTAGRDYALFALLFGAGLRISEALSLPVNLQVNGSLLVRGKGDKERRVPVSDAVRDALAGYEPDHYALAENRLFPLTRGGVSLLIAKYSKLAGISKRFTPHSCRHTFGYLAYRGSRDIRAVQSVLGHASIKTTEIYTQLSDEATRATVEGVRW